jgi:hypothetical protein
VRKKWNCLSVTARQWASVDRRRVRKRWSCQGARRSAPLLNGIDDLLARSPSRATDAVEVAGSKTAGQPPSEFRDPSGQGRICLDLLKGSIHIDALQALQGSTCTRVFTSSGHDRHPFMV